MREFTPAEIARHLRWVYSQPGYYKEEHERSRHNKRKIVSSPNQTIHSRARRRNSRINASEAKPKILKNSSSIKKKESKLKTKSRQGKSEIPKWD